MNNHLSTGRPDRGRPFFYFIGAPDKHFEYAEGDTASMQSAEQAASDFANLVIAHRNKLAGRTLSDREAAFGPVKRDPRSAREKTLGQIELANFSLAADEQLSERERVARQLEIEAAEEKRKRRIAEMSPAERRAFDAREAADHEAEQAEMEKLRAKHLSDPVVKQTLAALDEMLDVRRFSDAFNQADVEELQKAKLAISNPDWKGAGREFVRKVFARENERRKAEQQQTRSWLKSQEQLLEEKRTQLKTEKPESQRLAETLLAATKIEGVTDE